MEPARQTRQAELPRQLRSAGGITISNALQTVRSRCRLAQLSNPDPVLFRALLGRFLAAVERFGDFLEAFALARQRAQLGDLLGLPGLAVAGEALAHAFAAVFATTFFFAGAFLRAPFFAGPLAAFSSINTTAASAVSASGSVPRGRVALVVPSVT